MHKKYQKGSQNTQIHHVPGDVHQVILWRLRHSNVVDLILTETQKHVENIFQPKVKL